MTMGGQYDAHTDRSAMEREQDKDRTEDGAMTSNSGKGQLGPRQQWTGNNEET